MTTVAVQIIARGPRAVAEAAAQAIDADPMLEGVTYSILEEDEDRDVWRIDAFPTSDDESRDVAAALAGYPQLKVLVEKLADADWLAMALSGLPPVRAGRFFVYGAHDKGRAPVNAVNLRIEAGAAFGTGHHGTTVGCLQAYHDLLKAHRYERVLDVGAGTGVLAIAAARTGLGARPRLGSGKGALRPGVRQHPGSAAGGPVARYQAGPEARRHRHPLGSAAHPGTPGPGGLSLQGLHSGPTHPPRRLGHPGDPQKLGTAPSDRRSRLDGGLHRRF